MQAATHRSSPCSLSKSSRPWKSMRWCSSSQPPCASDRGLRSGGGSEIIWFGEESGGWEGDRHRAEVLQRQPSSGAIDVVGNPGPLSLVPGSHPAPLLTMVGHSWYGSGALLASSSLSSGGAMVMLSQLHGRGGAAQAWTHRNRASSAISLTYTGDCAPSQLLLASSHNTRPNKLRKCRGPDMAAAQLSGQGRKGCVALQPAPFILLTLQARESRLRCGTTPPSRWCCRRERKGRSRSVSPTIPRLPARPRACCKASPASQPTDQPGTSTHL